MKYQWLTIEHISYADINNCINSTILRYYQLCERDIMDTNGSKAIVILIKTTTMPLRFPLVFGYNYSLLSNLTRNLRVC